MKDEKFSIKKRLKSFKYAFNGLKLLFQEEHNSRIHLAAALLVIIAGFYFNITLNEWLILIFAISLVFVVEIINSVIENLSDFVSPENNTLIKKAKDMGAAAVLLASLAALIIGLLIFIPKIL
jgi:diacylglycerol kinase